jgi:long-chain acyl-CoA synthetase
MGDLGFWALAQEDPDYLALVTPEGDEVRAGELLGHANQLVHALRAQGLEPGDVVATVLPNCAEMIEIYLAALQAGWYLVPINHHLVAPEIAYILKDSGAKVFVAHERFAAASIAAADEVGLPPTGRVAVGTVEGFSSYRGIRDAQPTTLPEDRTLGDVMNYTSGTTGNPKGIFRKLPGVTPEQAAVGLGGVLYLFSVQPHDDNVHIIGSPLYHTAVLRFGSASMHFGHTVVLMDKWTPEGMLDLIARYRVTTTHMVPTHFKRLLSLPDAVRASADVSSLRHMIHGAAPCPLDVKKQMIQWWGNVIIEYYAASEGGGTTVTAEEWMRKPGTVGKAWPISKLKVLKDDGTECAPREIGTVYMNMGLHTFEYHKDKKKTDSSWKDGFFTVGDAGYLDEDGYLFLSDRKADMIISGGVNIYPAEIESALLAHPKVRDAAVFGIPDDDWGEHVKAVIEPASGVVPGPALVEEILAFLRERLASFKIPRSVDFTEELPRDPNGKLYKRKLRDPYWAGRDRAI